MPAFVAMVVCVAGCSSGHSSARSTTTATTIRSASPGPSPEQAAVSLANRMLDEAVLPPGARHSDAAPPAPLRTPFSVPGIGNLVEEHQFWTAPGDMAAVKGYLQDHPPRAFFQNGPGSYADRTVVLSWDFEDSLRRTPPNISDAELQVDVAAGPHGTSFLRVDAEVGWTEPRPSDAYAVADDRSVTVTIVRGVGRQQIATAVVVTDPKAVVPIVRAFNSLQVAPPQRIMRECFDRGVSYHVAFATRRARHRT